MKIGDLVEILPKETESATRQAMRAELGKCIGVILETRCGHVDGNRAIAKVEWFGDYGAFWTHTNDLIILSKK